MYNTLLKTDFYKCCHMMQYNENITQFVSYMVPRGSRLKEIDQMVFFGLSGFIKKYLIDDFNNNFFKKDFSEISNEFYEVLEKGLGYNAVLIEKTLDKVKKLHDLGYLPITIRALPEGTLCPMGIPIIEITTTHDELPWVGQAIESLLSCSIWHPCIATTVAYQYAKITKKAYDKTVDNGDYRSSLCDFSLRGQESYESAVASAAGWLTAMHNSSTVEARDYIESNYLDVPELSIGGLTSTEHSVMTSDFAITGDERETYRRLLTEVYPNVSFAAVCDSYDFWRVLVNILPTLKDEIEAHQGFLGVRHDSAESVLALCGYPTLYLNKDLMSKNEFLEVAKENCIFDGEDGTVIYRFVTPSNDYTITFEPLWGKEHGGSTDYSYWYIEGWKVKELRTTTYEDKGMVETMYELFGGTTNSKGYKVMNPKLKAVYGDSITLQRAKKIFERLAEKGFAANNVSLGVGSFSMECIEENGELKPFTRDTFSIAIKATAARITDKEGNDKWIPVYKDPKGFSQKKSIKGFAIVLRDEEGNLTYKDELSVEEYLEFRKQNLDQMSVYYKNGNSSLNSFESVRERVDEEVKNI